MERPYLADGQPHILPPVEARGPAHKEFRLKEALLLDKLNGIGIQEEKGTT
jgi:hypothetical protein